MAKDEGLPVRGWSFITCGGGGGAAILLGGHFQNLDCFWGVIFRYKGSITWGVIKLPQ